MGVRSSRDLWRVRPSVLAPLLLALAVRGVGCNDATDSPGPTALRIEPADGLSLLPGESYQLRAVATDSRGSQLPTTRFVWKSDDENVATVNSWGGLAAHAAGSTLIHASAANVSAHITVAVLIPVAKITLEPAAPVAVVGQPLQLVATMETADGHPIEGQPTSWQTSNPSVAQVSETGVLTPVSAGTTEVSATCGGKTAAVSVVVLAPIDALRVVPEGITLHPNETHQLTATLTDPEGNPLEGRPTTWSSSNTRIATVSTAGLVTARRVGTTFIRADAEGQRDSASVEVEARVRTVKVSPEQKTIHIGETLQLEANPKDADGHVLTGRDLAWESSEPEVASVSDAGLVTGRRAGESTIRATSEGQIGRAEIKVQERVARIAITPQSKELTVGQTVQLVATLHNAEGEVITGRRVSWSSERSSVATVSSSGRVTARGEGTAIIEASSDGVEGHATIEVKQPKREPVVFVGAGDIGSCDGDGDEATARLLDNIPGVVFVAGDNAYPGGSTAAYECYDESWGRHKSRTRPVPGNHEYETPGASVYFDYFGAAAGNRSTGYYSYNLGTWHILALNTQFSGREDTPQAEWVEDDLAANRRQCTLAIWHVPLFGPDSASTRMKYIFQLLYEAGAEVVVNGHEHNYQRFAPQTADGVADPERGIREFIVGTGGRGVGGTNTPVPNREVFYARSGGFGVLKLTLRDGSYDWEFIPVAGTSFRDSGSARCH